jgi:hypothetical protein
VGERGPIDTRTAPPEPPPGGLVLKLYYRTLTRADDTELRHARKQDFVLNYSMAKEPNSRISVGEVEGLISRKAFYEAQPDFMWLTEAEWKSLLPEHPTPGAATEVPAAVRERLFRYHLVPTMAYGEAIGWPKKDIREGKLSLTVEEVSKDNVRLRLEGFALLGPDFEATRRILKEKRRASGYEPRLLGYLEYHPAKKTITRFDIVALGDTYGMLQEGLLFFYRPRPQPLGVAFGMVGTNVPANRVFPRAAPGGEYYRQYFATGK